MRVGYAARLLRLAFPSLRVIGQNEKLTAVAVDFWKNSGSGRKERGIGRRLRTTDALSRFHAVRPCKRSAGTEAAAARWRGTPGCTASLSGLAPRPCLPGDHRAACLRASLSTHGGIAPGAARPLADPRPGLVAVATKLASTGLMQPVESTAQNARVRRERKRAVITATLGCALVCFPWHPALPPFKQRPSARSRIRSTRGGVSP